MKPATPARQRLRLRVTGTVQGVGFRPFVHRLAVERGLVGFVGNDPEGVTIEVEGLPAAIDRFAADLVDGAPPLAVVEGVASEQVPLSGGDGFVIVESGTGGSRVTFVPPDAGPCPECTAELLDPTDRRHLHPFANCTSCGPRFTIIGTLPYDRPTTTMASFEMCHRCAAEYQDPSDRRFHAQPVCCPDCGPRVRLTDAAGTSLDAGDAVVAAARLLVDGAIVAVKGVGGYHLAVDASSEPAVAELRARKHREEKPFAVLVADVAAARQLAEVGPGEAALMASPERPIVLVRATVPSGVAPSVAPGNRHLGLMLPPSPLHLLLARTARRPLVLTSGNRSDEPIAHRDTDAFERLGGIADAFCTHDRSIHVRVDDSVARLVANRPVVLRRARGYAPRPVTVPWEFPRPVLACGAQLKSTICVAKGHHAVVSHHLGDLDDAATFDAYLEAVAHYQHLFDVAPAVVAHDLHPEYQSTRFATELDGVELRAVQHHHAHIASCLADNRFDEAVIGVAFDGLGWGPDGTAWGGEVLAADLSGYDRVGHLARVPMPGGDAATRQPWRMAAAHLAAADVSADQLPVHQRHADAWGPVSRLSGSHAPLTSSMGRLFDAAAAVVGVRDEVTYEGQAAIELEQHADLDERGSYPVSIDDGTPFVIDGSAIVAAVADDVVAGVPSPVVAARFHNTVVDLVEGAVERAVASSGLSTVALSGGVFQNAVLVEQLVRRLRQRGWRVLTHRQVPPNDGGISLGQAAVAAALDRQ